MARDPADRPQSAQEFVARLDQLQWGSATGGTWPVMILPDAPNKPPEEQRRPAARDRATPTRRQHGKDEPPPIVRTGARAVMAVQAPT